MDWWPVSITRLHIIDLGPRGQHNSLVESSECRISHCLSRSAHFPASQTTLTHTLKLCSLSSLFLGTTWCFCLWPRPWLSYRLLMPQGQTLEYKPNDILIYWCHASISVIYSPWGRDSWALNLTMRDWVPVKGMVLKHPQPVLPLQISISAHNSWTKYAVKF